MPVVVSLSGVTQSGSLLQIQVRSRRSLRASTFCWTRESGLRSGDNSMTPYRACAVQRQAIQSASDAWSVPVDRKRIHKAAADRRSKRVVDRRDRQQNDYYFTLNIK